MDIHADRLAKRFRRQWVFRQLSIHISSGESWAVTGPNGSGKSTLLKILAGVLPPSEGNVTYALDGRQIPPDQVYRRMVYAAPYVDLIEEMSLSELFAFHGTFREVRYGRTITEFVDVLGPAFAPSTIIKEMSSGMKQRVRLALALSTESSLVILDEPTTNLDEQGRKWFEALLGTRHDKATLIIASNVEDDLTTCRNRLYIPDYVSGK